MGYKLISHCKGMGVFSYVSEDEDESLYVIKTGFEDTQAAGYAYIVVRENAYGDAFATQYLTALGLKTAFDIVIPE